MPKTLLLADDSVTIQKVVGISFANEDVTLLTVDNGDDAVSRAREVRPDIVLADVVMPGKNGYEVCEAIKQDADLASVPVLLLTGTFEAFDETRAQRVGADGHITKPFEAQALVDQVNALLARAAAASPVAPEPVATPSPATATATATAAAPSGGGSFEFFDEGAADPGASVETPAAETSGAAIDETPTPAFHFDADGAAQTLPGHAAMADRPSPEETVVMPAGMAMDAFATAAPATEPSTPVIEAIATEDDPISDAEPLLDSFEDVPAPTALGDSGQDLAGDAVMDPAHGRDFDVSSSDLGDSFTNLAAPAVASEPEVSSPMMPEPEPMPAPIMAEPEPVSAPMAEPEPVITPSPMAIPRPAAMPIADEPDPGMTLLSPAEAAADVSLTNPTPSETSGELSAAGREQIRETLEKVAWEAFGRAAESLVKEAVERLEKVAWEVVPQMAETLIKEEIRRLKSEDSSQG